MIDTKTSTTSLSVVTATFNAESALPGLIESLRSQTDHDFSWIVADGVSTDSTLKLLAACSDLKPLVLSQSDFGIYDAINRGLRQVVTEYYLVMGADDRLMPDGIAQFKAAIISSRADIVTAGYKFNGGVCRAKKRASWYYGMSSFISGHSVGTVFKKSLHHRFGFYSRKFPIAADQLFVRQAIAGGASCFVSEGVVGEYSNEGLSSTDRLGALTEIFRIQLEFENKFLQTILFIARLLRHFRFLR